MRFIVGRKLVPAMIDQDVFVGRSPIGRRYQSAIGWAAEGLLFAPSEVKQTIHPSLSFATKQD